jgi:hypothetical protein
VPGFSPADNLATRARRRGCAHENHSSSASSPSSFSRREFQQGIVEEINDRKIHSLKEMAEAFSQAPEFFVIKFKGNGRPVVLERAAVEAARERIKTRYNVLSERNLEENPGS